MKKLFLFVISLYIFGGAFGQHLSGLFDNQSFQKNINFYYSKYGFSSEGIYNLVFITDINMDTTIKTRTEKLYYFKKGSKAATPKFIITKEYNNGVLTHYKNSSKGKTKESSYLYNKDGYYTQYISKKNDKIIDKENVTYNDSNKVTLFVFLKKDKPKEKRVYTYENGIRNTRRDIYKKGHEEPDMSWVREYYEGGGLKKSEYYKKGKLKTQWIYTCDEEGQKVDPKKAKTKLVCKIDQNNNDGSYVKIFRTTDDKGRVVKTRWTYNKDSLLTMYERINHKDITLNKSVYTYDAKGNETKSEIYKRGGEVIRYAYEFQYDNNNNIIDTKRYNKKGKLKSHTSKKFNPSNKITEQVVYKTNGKIKRKTNYEYNQRGNITKKIVFHGEKPYQERDYEYIYSHS